MQKSTLKRFRLRARSQPPSYLNLSVGRAALTAARRRENVLSGNLPVRTGLFNKSLGELLDRYAASHGGLDLQFVDHFLKLPVGGVPLSFRVVDLLAQRFELGFLLIELFCVSLQQSFLLGTAA